jgi:hypothetical protein
MIVHCGCPFAFQSFTLLACAHGNTRLSCRDSLISAGAGYRVHLPKFSALLKQANLDQEVVEVWIGMLALFFSIPLRDVKGRDVFFVAAFRVRRNYTILLVTSNSDSDTCRAYARQILASDTCRAYARQILASFLTWIYRFAGAMHEYAAGSEERGGG